VDTVGSPITVPALAARLKLQRRAADTPAFLLDVSIAAPPGITILFGPSGAGKSTLLDCLAGLLCADEGRISVARHVLFDSQAKVNLPPQARGIAYVFQTLALFPHMTAEENIAYGLAHLPREERRARADEVLQAFHIEEFRARKPRDISGGERQRIALARSLVTQPGLEAHLKTAIVDDLRSWNAARRIPILYVTHSREEVSALGERVIAMDHGRVVGEGTPLEVLEAPRQRRLAQAAGFENFLSGTVVDLREKEGVMRLRVGESRCEIEVPLGFAQVGDRVCVAVRAGDILLAVQPPHGLSARNVLEGKILRLETRGVLVEARVNCGTEFVVHVTPGAVRALDLAEGQHVWLVLKTHSCHLVEN
jgi:molybdate transport system ATP-binding protein